MDAFSARDILLALPGVAEHDHFGKAAYRGTTPKGKHSRIFLTLWIEENRAVLLIDAEQQAALHALHPSIFFTVPNKWGAKGATFVELSRCPERLFREAVAVAMLQAGCA